MPQVETMIIARSPMFVNILGDPSYSNSAISLATDKFVYVAINQTPLVDHISARYSITETVNDVKLLKNERIKLALLKFGITKNIEVGSFASIPMEVGFKSYLSFTTALMRGLHSLSGEFVDQDKLVKEVIEIEESINGSAISKQGVYTAVCGGINLFNFNDGHKIISEPIFLDFHERLNFEDLVKVYFVKSKVNKNIKQQKDKNNITKSTPLDSMVIAFKKALFDGEIEQSAFVLHKSWILEKTLGVNIPPNGVQDFYDKALSIGAMGGKYIGDENSGCLILMAEEKVHNSIKQNLGNYHGLQFSDYKIGIVQSGATTIYKLKI